MYCNVCKEDKERYDVVETRSGKPIVVCTSHTLKRIGESPYS